MRDERSLNGGATQVDSSTITADGTSFVEKAAKKGTDSALKICLKNTKGACTGDCEWFTHPFRAGVSFTQFFDGACLSKSICKNLVSKITSNLLHKSTPSTGGKGESFDVGKVLEGGQLLADLFS